MCTYIHIHTHTYTYIRIHTYIHIHTHTHKDDSKTPLGAVPALGVKNPRNDVKFWFLVHFAQTKSSFLKSHKEALLSTY